MNITKQSMSIINSMGFYCIFETSGKYYILGSFGKNYKGIHSFRISLDEKTKCN